MEKQPPIASSTTSSDLNVASDVANGDAGRGPVLEKPFRIWSTVGIQYSVMSTPFAVGAFLSLSVGVGGSPVFFFAYVLVVIMNLCICCSLAEIAAVYPHASGTLYSVLQKIV